MNVQALGQLSQTKPALLVDFAAIAKGGRPAIERIFGKPIKTEKYGSDVQYIYKSKNFRTVTAYYLKDSFGFSVEYKPKDVKDWKTILAQVGLSATTPRDVHRYFHWMDSIYHFNEIPKGTVIISRERVKKSEKYTGWVDVMYDSKARPNY